MNIYDSPPKTISHPDEIKVQYSFVDENLNVEMDV